jgi:hypothetical protein
MGMVQEELTFQGRLASTPASVCRLSLRESTAFRAWFKKNLVRGAKDLTATPAHSTRETLVFAKLKASRTIPIVVKTRRPVAADPRGTAHTLLLPPENSVTASRPCRDWT